MRTATNQTLFDIAIQESGSVYAVVDWAVKNNVSPTAILVPGTELQKPDSDANYKADVARYFNGRIIATGITETEEINTDYTLPQVLPMI